MATYNPTGTTEHDMLYGWHPEHPEWLDPDRPQTVLSERNSPTTALPKGLMCRLVLCLAVLLTASAVPAAATVDTSDSGASSFVDDFSTDHWASGRYTLVVGTGALRRNLAENTEEATSTAEKKAFLDWGTHKYEDVEASIDYYVPTASSGHVSPMIKGRLVDGKLYHLKARYSATNDGINIQKFVNGVTTNLVGYTTAFRRGTGWKRMVLRAVGNTLTASHYGLDENRQNPVHDATEKVTLTGQDAIDFGAGVRGDVGRRWVPSDFNWRADNFYVGDGQ